VVFHGAGAQVHPGADLAVREPLGEQHQHLPLALGERGHRAYGRLVVDAAEKAVDHRAGDLGRQDGLARRQRPDQMPQLLRVGVLEQETRRSGAQRGGHVLVGVEGGEHRHDRGSGQPADALQNGQPVGVRHPDVQQDDVGVQLPDGVQRLAAGDGRDGLDAVRRVQDVLETRPDQGFVVDHQYSDHLRFVPDPLLAGRAVVAPERRG
jgi:hypothetical protein